MLTKHFMQKFHHNKRKMVSQIKSIFSLNILKMILIFSNSKILEAMKMLSIYCISNGLVFYSKSEILLTLYSLCKWYVWHYWKRSMNARFFTNIKYISISKCMWKRAVLELHLASISVVHPYACEARWTSKIFAHYSKEMWFNENGHKTG